MFYLTVTVYWLYRYIREDFAFGPLDSHCYTGNIVISRIVISGFHCITVFWMWNLIKFLVLSDCHYTKKSTKTIQYCWQCTLLINMCFVFLFQQYTSTCLSALKMVGFRNVCKLFQHPLSHQESKNIKQKIKLDSPQRIAIWIIILWQQWKHTTIKLH